MATASFPNVKKMVEQVERADHPDRVCFDVDPDALYPAMFDVIDAVRTGDAPLPDELAAGDKTFPARFAAITQRGMAAARNESGLRAVAEDPEPRAEREAVLRLARLMLDYALHHAYPDAVGIAIRVGAGTDRLRWAE